MTTLPITAGDHVLTVFAYLAAPVAAWALIDGNQDIAQWAVIWSLAMLLGRSENQTRRVCRDWAEYR